MLDWLLNDWGSCCCVVLVDLKISRDLIERHDGQICRFSGMKKAECDCGGKKKIVSDECDC